MKNSYTNNIILLFLLYLVTASCVEPYQLQTNTFEDALVIEATITNELKKQEIKISRTYRLEENGPTFEAGAQVYVTDSDGNQYDFEQAGNIYRSISEFTAIQGKQYQLNITTADGKSYRSNKETLTTENQIESVVAAVAVADDGQRGVEIAVNSYDPSNMSKYYRYTYEETYKIIAPKWVATDLFYDMISDSFQQTLRATDTRICYSTAYSNEIILANTNGQTEDRITNFPVRFISTENFIISHRYSILVKQYIQSLGSYTFYKTLKELSSSESLLSQTQPGFFYGNLKSIDNPNEKVIGFFDVSSVSQKRIFFNYADLFPGEPLPPYFNACNLMPFDTSIPGTVPGNSPKDKLIQYIELNKVRYYSTAFPIYNMVIPECGDCTSFSSNIVPPFWIN